MIEFWDYLSQFLAVTAGFCAALRAYLKSREQPWFLLTCFYGTFALGTLYWTLHLLLRQETPQVFYVSDLAWLASYVFLLALTLTLPDAGSGSPGRGCAGWRRCSACRSLGCMSPTAICFSTSSCAA